MNPSLAIVSAAGRHLESHYVVVSIQTNEGIIGYGEATLTPAWSGESQGGALFAIREILSPFLIGKDPLQINALTDSIDRMLIGNPFTKAAVEMALLDIAAKFYHIPVPRLPGGARRAECIGLKFMLLWVR